MNYLKQFKNYFIPHKHNAYKPHFFRIQAVLATAGLIVFFFVVALTAHNLVIQSGISQVGAVISSVLVDLTNGDRKDNNLQGLTVSPVLQKAAQMKADDMAAKGYFAHESPEGVTPWHWFKEAGYSFSFAGENLAVYFSDSAELEKAWMNSPSHRANILNSYFTEIGIGIAKGVYQGKETVFVVQEFGRPSMHTAASQQDVPVKNETNTTPKTVPTSTKVALNETPTVKGATVAEIPDVQTTTDATDMFIAVKSDENGSNTPIVLSQNNTVVAGTSAAESVPLALKAVTSPRTSLGVVYSFLGVFILIALALMVGIEIKRQHPVHILYGILLVVLMGGLFYAWQGFLFGKLNIA